MEQDKGSRQVSDPVVEVLKAVLLKIQTVWDGMLCCCTAPLLEDLNLVNSAMSRREAKINVHRFHSNLPCIVTHVCMSLINYKIIVCNICGTQWCLLI
jgi:hypothetical protein